MDRKDKQQARKSRDVTTQIEEENLWDLGDDWDDEPESRTLEAQDTAETNQEKQLTEEKIATDTEDTFAEPATDGVEQELEGQPTAETEDEQPAKEEQHHYKSIPSPDETPETPTDEADEESADEADEESTDEADEEPSEPVDETLGGITTPISVAFKKLSLNTIEKIALATVAAALVALVAWGCIWLNDKNKTANTREKVDLPAVGKHATISGLSTFWITPESGPGVNLNAVVVPSVIITLDENAGSAGALRLYFQDAEKNSVGDPITLPFKNGKFSNESNTIEVSASDGFHKEGQFHAYQVDQGTPWRVLILEAPSVSSSGSEFNNLIDAPVSAQRK